MPIHDECLLCEFIFKCYIIQKDTIIKNKTLCKKKIKNGPGIKKK
jgi:hypothetical protein